MGCTTSTSLEPRCQGMEHILKLYTAIQKCNYMEARQLITKGASVNCINYIGGTPLIETCRTPLLQKRERERESFVRFLISSGAEMDFPDIFGGTAIIYAKQNGLQSIVNMLEQTKGRETGKEKKYYGSGNLCVTICFRLCDHSIGFWNCSDTFVFLLNLSCYSLLNKSNTSQFRKLATIHM